MWPNHEGVVDISEPFSGFVVCGIHAISSKCSLAGNDGSLSRKDEGQEETKAAINSVRSELEETIKTRTQGLRAELDEKIMETQRQVEVVMASIHTRTENP
jgi:hypothetical protein